MCEKKTTTQGNYVVEALTTKELSYEKTFLCSYYQYKYSSEKIKNNKKNKKPSNTRLNGSFYNNKIAHRRMQAQDKYNSYFLKNKRILLFGKTPIDFFRFDRPYN